MGERMISSRCAKVNNPTLVSVQNIGDLCGDCVEIGRTVDTTQHRLAAVVINQRCGLGVIGLKPAPHGLFVIVGPAFELGRAATVADPIYLGRLEGIVIALTTGRARKTANNPLYEYFVVDLQLDDVAELLGFLHQ